MKNEIKILMIDNDEKDFIITRDLFSGIDFHNYSLDWVQSYEEGVKLISKKTHDIYLVDYHLGQYNGLDLIHEMQTAGCDLPLILLTEQNNIKMGKKVKKYGAADYLIKEKISPELLDRSIQYSLDQVKKIKEIKKLNDDLERKVKERTKALTENIHKLDKSKSTLAIALGKEKELNELKSQFVSLASHEFRTPLSTILSSLSLIKTYGEMNNLEKQDKHIVKIESSVRNLTELLNHFLSVSKLEEGMIAAVQEEFNTASYISEICSEMKLTSKNEQVINYHHLGDKTCYLDKHILKNILYNLISNAIKFTPNGGTIEIISEGKISDLTITVKDNGIGISKKDQIHLFKRFFRGENAQKIQGTGLGLNIVLKYVELMKGKICVSSEENHGTTFTLTFPQ